MTPGFRPRQNSPPQGSHTVQTDMAKYPAAFPESLLDEFYTQMNKWKDKGKILVMTTQVANEGSNMTVYEVGKKVKLDFKILEAYDMTMEATITKMMWLMGMGDQTFEEMKQDFYRLVNHDILFTKRMEGEFR